MCLIIGGMLPQTLLRVNVVRYMHWITYLKSENFIILKHLDLGVSDKIVDFCLLLNNLEGIILFLKEFTHARKSPPKTCQPWRWNRGFTEASVGIRGSPVGPAETTHFRGCERKKNLVLSSAVVLVFVLPVWSNCVSRSHYRNYALQKPTNLLLLPLQQGQ